LGKKQNTGAREAKDHPFGFGRRQYAIKKKRRLLGRETGGVEKEEKAIGRNL